MKKLFPIIFVLLSLSLGAQVISSSRWSDLFSYNNVLAIREGDGKLIAATENGLFFYTPTTGETTKLSKANGLHEVKISAFDYNAETKIGLVGYQNGSLDVITPEGITYVVDIPLATGYTGDKKINHVSITGNLAVISVGYGVSIFRLDKKEFGDSAFFRNSSGVYEAAKEAVIKDNVVYVVTSTGFKSHEINTTFALYSNWNSLQAGNFLQAAVGGTIAYSDLNTVRFGSGSSFSTLPRSFTDIQDVIVTAQNIIVTEKTSISVFDLNGNFIRNFDVGEALNTAFYSKEEIFAGTKVSGIKNEARKNIKPDGPYHNTSYKITLQDEQIWISSGNRTNRYNHAAPHPNNLGFYYYTGSEWIYPDYFIKSGKGFNVLDVTPNPIDTKEVFFTNYIGSNDQGIYKMKYNAGRYDFVKFYTRGGGGTYNRPVGLAFDENNNLFTTIAYMDTSAAGDTGYGVYNRSGDLFNYRNLPTLGGIQKPLIAEGLLWIPLPRTNNFAAVDYKNTANTSDDQLFLLDNGDGLPSNSQGSISVALDKSGDLWIGTDNGLRILPSAASSIKESNTEVESVIIEENGVGEELFRDSSVLQIEVDSGNQKWVSISGGGVFYLSPNGEKTIRHFTKENSPLPSNSVTDIKVDNKTGKVYFVTFDGVMVYKGDVVDVNEKFGKVLVYPNPVVQANYKGNVRLRGLAEKTNIRITDAAGNVVHQAVARGGYYEWNLNNHRGVRVASGIYFVLMTNADGTDTATAKIAVVN